MRAVPSNVAETSVVIPARALIEAEKENLRKQIARFKHEAQAAAQLHHPNIVSVFAVGVERGVHYYAMQFIEGRTLSEALRRAGGRRPGEHRLLRSPDDNCY